MGYTHGLYLRIFFRGVLKAVFKGYGVATISRLLKIIGLGFLKS